MGSEWFFIVYACVLVEKGRTRLTSLGLERVRDTVKKSTLNSLLVLLPFFSFSLVVVQEFSDVPADLVVLVTSMGLDHRC